MTGKVNLEFTAEELRLVILGCGIALSSESKVMDAAERTEMRELLQKIKRFKHEIRTDSEESGSG
jgi:hypothetical protein